MEKQRVLHLTSSKNFSDIERSIIHMAKLLNDTCEIACATLEGSITKIMRKNEINYFPLESLSYKSVKEVIDQFEPTIIHAHDFEASIIASNFSKKIKVISNIHKKDDSFSKFSLESLKYKSASKSFEKVIWPSEECMYDYKYIKSIEEKSIIIKKSINCEDTISKSLLQKGEKTLSFEIILFYENESTELFTKFLNILGILKGRGFSFKCGIISDYLSGDECMQYTKELRTR